MPRIAHIAADDGEIERGQEDLNKIARSTAEESADAARESSERALISVADAAEKQRQMVHQSAGEAAELGRVIADLLDQQTRHNMQAAAAFGRTFNWAEAAEIQRDFLKDSFERMVHFAERYRATIQVGMTSMTFQSRR